MLLLFNLTAEKKKLFTLPSLFTKKQSHRQMQLLSSLQSVSSGDREKTSAIVRSRDFSIHCARREIVIVKGVRALHPSWCRRLVQCFDSLSRVFVWVSVQPLKSARTSINARSTRATNSFYSEKFCCRWSRSSGTLKQKVIIKVITASTHSLFVASAIEEMGKQFHATCNYDFFLLLEALHLKAATFMSSTNRRVVDVLFDRLIIEEHFVDSKEINQHNRRGLDLLSW